MTKAIILAAGLGSRLRPLTYNKPKCLIELFGETLLSRQLRVLEGCGVDDVLVVGGYLADEIIKLGYRVIVNTDFEDTNMVWTLFVAEKYFNKKEDIVVVYGDIVFEKIVLTRLLRSDHNLAVVSDQNWLDLWSVRMPNPLNDVESFKIDGAGFIKELGKKPNSLKEIEGQFIGLIKIKSDIVADVSRLYAKMSRSKLYDGQVFRKMYMTSFIQFLIDTGIKAKAVGICNGWLEVDSLADLEIYESLHKTGALSKICKIDK